MKHLIILLLCFAMSTTAHALTGKEIYIEFINILKICKKTGFYKCEDRYFEGTSRGVFHTPIEKQRLSLTENKFDRFLEKHFGNSINISFFELTTYIKFNLEDKFDYSKYKPSNLIGKIQPLNKENTLFKPSFKDTHSVVLVLDNNKYKIGVLPEHESKYKKSKEFKSVYLYRLKSNILQYHMKEAEILNHDKKTFKKNINEALAPIVYIFKNAKISNLAKNFKIRSFKEIEKFYISLDTESKIVSRIKKINKL